MSINNVKYFLTTILFLIVLVLGAQTGPGGIGDMSVNGLWLCAEDIDTTDASEIENWIDRSGNVNDATNTTFSQRPLYYSTSSMNGQPIIRFDGNNDQMSIADADILDGSSGITVYTAIRPNNLNGSPRGILGKRISSGNNSDYAYTWYFWDGNLLYHDLNTQNNRFSSTPTTFSNATNYILAFNFDGTLAAAQRSKLYSGSQIIKVSSESSTSIVNSNRDLVLGALNINYGTYLGADYGEVIHFNYSLNSLEHIIIQNYLSAKFNVGISTNDLYIQDNVANGDYDFDVCAIGRIDASTIQNDAQGAARVRIMNPSDLGNDEFLFWGHDGGDEEALEFADVPPGVEARFSRVWRVNEVDAASNPVDVGSLEFRWDLSNLNTITTADLRMLIDTDSNGLFSDETPISGASHLGGNIYSFTGISQITDGVRFTIATADYSQTPLPVTLLDFKGEMIGFNEAKLTWKTSSEINNDHFSIEHSTSVDDWQEIARVKGKGNARGMNDYSYVDEQAIVGNNYYRLKQVDFDGSFDYSSVVVVSIEVKTGLIIRPNPAKTEVDLTCDRAIKNTRVFNINGTMLFAVKSTNLDVSALKKGLYIIEVELESGQFIQERLIID